MPSDIQLALAGTGPDEAVLRTLAASLGIASRVHLLGSVNHETLPLLLSAADVMVLPSEREGLANAWIEALACGTPVVAWRCGSTPEVIEPGVTGFLVDGDEEADRAVLAARKLNRADVRRRFDLRFSAGAMARRYVDLYERIGETREIVSPVANQIDPVLARTA